jgi:hypothetical protein
MEQYDRDTPLFDRRLSVLVQYPDRDEKLTPLTIRLLHGLRVSALYIEFFCYMKNAVYNP